MERTSEDVGGFPGRSDPHSSPLHKQPSSNCITITTQATRKTFSDGVTGFGSFSSKQRGLSGLCPVASEPIRRRSTCLGAPSSRLCGTRVSHSQFMKYMNYQLYDYLTSLLCMCTFVLIIVISCVRAMTGIPPHLLFPRDLCYIPIATLRPCDPTSKPVAREMRNLKIAFVSRNSSAAHSADLTPKLTTRPPSPFWGRSSVLTHSLSFSFARARATRIPGPWRGGPKVPEKTGHNQQANGAACGFLGGPSAAPHRRPLGPTREFEYFVGFLICPLPPGDDLASPYRSGREKGEKKSRPPTSFLRTRTGLFLWTGTLVRWSRGLMAKRPVPCFEGVRTPFLFI